MNTQIADVLIDRMRGPTSEIADPDGRKGGLVLQTVNSEGKVIGTYGFTTGFLENLVRGNLDRKIREDGRYALKNCRAALPNDFDELPPGEPQ